MVRGSGPAGAETRREYGGSGGTKRTKRGWYICSA